MESAQNVKEKSLLEGGIRTLCLPSKLENLVEARKFAADMATQCGFDDSEVFEIKLATGEAVSNAVEHGSPNGDANSVALTCRCTDGNFLVIVEDEGCFKKRVSMPNGTNYRGRGIPLMLAVMDKVAIDEKQDGTRITLSKRLPNLSR